MLKIIIITCLVCGIILFIGYNFLEKENTESKIDEIKEIINELEKFGITKDEIIEKL